MPVIKCPNNKYRIGTGPCMYSTKATADRAYKAYLAKKHTETEGLQEEGWIPINEFGDSPDRNSDDNR